MIQLVLKQYHTMPKGAKASFWTIISSIFLKGMGFITLPIFTRLLTTSEYGILSIYGSWVSLFSILITFTVWGGVFNVGMVKYPNRAKFVSAIQGLSVSSVMICFFIALFILDPLDSLLGMSSFLVICMFIEILVSIPFNIWLSEQTYDFYYKKKILLTIGMSILNPILGYFAIINFPWHVEARVLSGLIPQIIVSFYFFVKQQKRGKVFFDASLWRYVLGFNSVLILHYLSMQVLNQSDRIMINAFCGSSEAGIYSVAYNFAILLNLISNGMNSSLTSYVYRCMKAGTITKLAKINSLAAILVGGCALLLIALVPDIFKFMLPPDYYDALWIVPPVTLAAFFMYLYPMFGAIEFYYEVNKYVTFASCIGALLNIVLNAIFIPIFGYIVAAYTTLFCYICFAVSHYYFMKQILYKRGDNRKIFDGKKLFRISVIISLLSFVLLFLYEVRLYRWLFIFLLLILLLIKRKYFFDNLIMIKKRI